MLSIPTSHLSKGHLMKKFSWKTLVVAILFVCLIGYSIFSLNALPSTPVEADFDSTEAFSQAMDQYLANKKQVHAYITVGVLCVSALGFALEAAPVAVIAMVMPIFFGLTGILSVSEAFPAFRIPPLSYLQACSYWVLPCSVQDWLKRSACLLSDCFPDPKPNCASALCY